ncbi:MAG: beta-ketoacyl-[acyl-carrier-protein] synthase family protein [Phycisphaerales bacterium]
MNRRVVISGIGAVSGLGLSSAALWDALCAGRSALRPITRFDASGFPSRLGAQVANGPDGAAFSARDFVPKHYRKAVKVMARDIEIAVAAAKDAVEDAKLTTRATLPEESADPTTHRSDRMGCHIGAGLIAADADELAAALVTARRSPTSEDVDLQRWGGTAGNGNAGMMDNLTPLWLLKYLPNMLSCHVTILHGCEGPSNTITCAEASGLLSIGESMRVIRRGDADLCFSGGAESKLNYMGLLRMDFAKRLAPTSDETDGSNVVRPFDPASPGGLLGEGGGILILETLDAASARGARIHAEVLSVGAAHSGPPGAPGTPADHDAGCLYAIENSLEQARVKPEEIDAIVPLALGNVDTDAGEAGALRRVFGSNLKSIPLVTLAPALGGCVSGTGALQAAVAAMCVSRQMLPARIHAGQPPADLLAGPAPACSARLRHVLVCSGSQHGQHAAMVLRSVP